MATVYNSIKVELILIPTSTKAELNCPGCLLAFLPNLEAPPCRAALCQLYFNNVYMVPICKLICLNYLTANLEQGSIPV